MASSRFKIENSPLNNIGNITTQNINEELTKIQETTPQETNEKQKPIATEIKRERVDRGGTTTTKGLLAGYTRATLTIKQSYLELIEALENFTHKPKREILDILFSASLNSIDKNILEMALKEYKQLKKQYEARTDIIKKLEADFSNNDLDI